ncbi:PD-(D/E)XK motif protein [Lutimonas vermicola]|uniref:PD-(D/E)XK motif protein n=1 Tax=Lutimonas vermicola TaxID=414288 RepID=A0ABU9KXD2_9FLAO
MKTMFDIKKIWSRQSASLRNDVIKDPIEDILNLKCYIGTVSVSGAIFFSMEIPFSIEIGSNDLKRFTGVEVQILASSGKKKELTIILLDIDLMDIFVVFTEDIVNHIKEVSSSQEAIGIISSRIRYWKKLFGKYSNNILSPERQRGLFGELLFIKEMIESGNDMEETIRAWEGPSGTNQDFYHNSDAVEVKTSIANVPVIKISNERQLDVKGLDRLFLVFYHLNEVPDKNYSLQNLIINIQDHFKDSYELLIIFNKRLKKAGISEEMIDNYNTTGYKVMEEMVFEISENFPKITSSKVSEGISKISYEISLDSCVNFLIETQFLKNNFLNEKINK